MHIELFRKQYDFELEQRNTIASSTNLPILGLTVIGSALSSIIINFQYSQDLPSIAFIILVGLCALLMLRAVYYVVKSLIGYTYEKVPSATSMLNHFNELKLWHENQGNSVEKAKVDFDEYITERLSEAADKNSSNNITRGSFIHGATVTISYSFIFLVLSAPLYIYQKTLDNKQIYQVKLIQPISKEATMATSNSTTSTDSPTAAPTSPPSKPVGPKNEKFRGNADLGKSKNKGTDSTSQKR